MTSSRVNASIGGTVTLLVTSDSGYVLDVMTVTNNQRNTVKLTGKGSGGLDPTGLATQTQAAQMLMNFIKDE